MRASGTPSEIIRGLSPSRTMQPPMSQVQWPEPLANGQRPEATYSLPSTAARPGTGRPAPDRPTELVDAGRLLETDVASLRGLVDTLAREEAVLHLDDLLLRRMDGVLDPVAWRRFAGPAAESLGWSEARVREELERSASPAAPTSALCPPPVAR